MADSEVMEAEKPTKPKDTDEAIVKRVMARNNSLKSIRSTWDSLWQRIANYVQPRKDNITKKTEYPNETDDTILYDSTAVRANMTLANGLVAWICPADSPWFSWDPPSTIPESDAASQWYAECTKRSRMRLARSNFYSEIHENFLNDCFGTAVIYWQPGKNGDGLNYTSLEVGTFSLSKNSEGEIDTCYRQLMLTARQAEQEFGRENLSADMVKVLEKEESSGVTNETEWEFCHAMEPRPDDRRDTSKEDGPNKPWASITVELKSKKLVKNSGYNLKPFAASRFLKWGNHAYGWGPGVVALPECRQVNFLVKQMDALAETKAFPRFLLPDTMEGEVDLAAGGFTFFDPNNPNSIPKEWATSGDYNIGLEREKEKRDAIEKCFMADMFQMLANQEKQMTAREVAERVAEKFTQFSPAFARKTTELLNPLMSAIFQADLRSGLFPEPPSEVIQGTGKDASIGTPSVTFNSRISLVVKAQDNIAFQRQMEMIEPVLQVSPDILDNFDFQEITRDTARNNGLPPKWIRAQEDVDNIRSQRAQAQAQQQQMEQTQMAADAAAKVGSVKEDSVAGKMITAGAGSKPQAVPGIKQ